MSSYQSLALTPTKAPLLLLGLLLCTLFVHTGCRAPMENRTAVDWSQRFVEAQRLSDEEQRRALEQLLQEAPTLEKAHWARFELARLSLRGDDVEGARAHFEAIIADESGNQYESRAYYELGRIALTHDQDRPAARHLLTHAIVETAPWAGADFALDFWLRHRLADEQTIAELERMAGATKQDRMAARLHLERGRLLHQAEQSDRAIEAYRAAFERCEDCAATDDALMEMAAIYLARRDWASAEDALKIVAARTQRSFFVGTYHSHRASDARLALGVLEMDERANLEAAARHFRTFLSVFEGDRRSDQVAWRLVQIEAQTGSPRSLRRALENFLRDYPHSRLADQARRQLEEAS